MKGVSGGRSFSLAPAMTGVQETRGFCYAARFFLWFINSVKWAEAMSAPSPSSWNQGCSRANLAVIR